jgi:hypothetical protein
MFKPARFRARQARRVNFDFASALSLGDILRWRQAMAQRRRGRKWSADVTEHSDALDLPQAVFKSASARTIARSLKRSAQVSRRRKADPFRSAMSMLNFYINRAGRNLSTSRRRTLDAAKVELRQLFGRAPDPA